ncbi:unnamed protein product [Victoria cruziana]
MGPQPLRVVHGHNKMGHVELASYFSGLRL